MRAAAVLAAAVLLAVPASGAAATGAAATGGAQLFAANCASCHGFDGAGRPPTSAANGSGGINGFGPSLVGVGALAADFYLRTGYMPLRDPYAQPRRTRVLLSQRAIRSLVGYVASLGPGPAIPRPDPARGSVAQGLELFTSNCAGCHQVLAVGGYVPDAVAPPLAPDSARQIAEAVRIGPNLMPRFSQARLSDVQLDSIIAYLRYVRSPADPGGLSIGHVGPVPEGLVAWFVAGVLLVAVTLTVGRRLT